MVVKLCDGASHVDESMHTGEYENAMHALHYETTHYATLNRRVHAFQYCSVIACNRIAPRDLLIVAMRATNDFAAVEPPVLLPALLFRIHE